MTRVYIESEAGLFGQDDGAEVIYHVGPNTDSDFQIAYHDHEDADPTIIIDWQSLSTLNNPVGSTTQLQWRKDNNSPFFLASRQASSNPQSSLVSSNNPPEDWMHSIYDQISCLSLQEIVVPGSHDAGIFEFNEGTGGASALNTVTQITDIGDQLKYGSRWFDIRPVISGGAWKTGHYSWTFGSWRGGNGQDIKSIIAQINTFTEKNNELIILDVTHGLYTDDWAGEHDSGLTQDQWDGLMEELLTLNNRVTDTGNIEDLTRLRMDQLIQDRAAVLVVIDDAAKDGKTVDTSRFADQGIFNRTQFPLYNRYSDENVQEIMIQDQLSKLEKNRPSPTSTMFLLSWTLTQHNPVLPIVENSEGANRALPELLWPALSSETYPNVLCVDAYPDNADIVALAISIILYFARTCGTY